MTALTNTGITRTRLAERVAELEAKYQGIFGADIDLSPDTIDGQTIGVFAEFISNEDQLAEDVYQSFNPQTATGVALSRLVQLNGIRRIAGIYSTATITCVGQFGTLIPAGSLVKSTATQATFATVGDVTIGASGQVNVPVQATEYGALAAPAGTLSKIDNPVYGWQTATNATAATLGRLEETDEQLRIRRRASTATPAVSVLDGVYAGLLGVANVRHCRVYENDQDTVQPLTGLPPHSLFAVADGGTDADIANMLWIKRTLGSTQIGTTSVVINDTQGVPHTMKFSRPTDVTVWVTVNLHTRSGWPTDGATRIQNAIAAFALENQGIGVEVIESRLYTPINTVLGHSIDSVLIGTSANPTSNANIAVPFDAIARFDVSRIVVNVL